MIMEQPMVVKIVKSLLTKDDQTTKIKFVWNCEEDDIDDENYKNNKVAKEVEEKEKGEMEVIKMCAKMCEFDGSNQPCTRSYHSLTHALMWYYHNCMQFMANCDWSTIMKSQASSNCCYKVVWIS